MTSVLRGFRDVKTGLTKFGMLQTQTYYDSSPDINGDEVPIPFIVIDGVLDINIQDNVQEDCIDIGQWDNERPDFKVRQIGNDQKVFSLGPKFLEWIRNVIGNIETNTSPGDNPPADPFTGAITLDIAPLMTDCQYTVDNQYTTEDWNGYPTLENDQTINISFQRPSGENYITGVPSNNYRRVSVFKTPLTLSWVSTNISNGDRLYLTLTSDFDSY